MDKKERPKFPKGFFTQSRPTISTKEALKDIVPIEWSKDVTSGKNKAIVYSTKERKVL